MAADNAIQFESGPSKMARDRQEMLEQREADVQMWTTVGTAAAVALPVSIVIGFVCTTLFLLNIRKALMARLSISFGALSMLALTALAISLYGCGEALENSR